MELEDAWQDATVAAAAAGSAIAATLILEYVLVAEASPLLRLAPLGVYFVYLFVHRRLPEGLAQSSVWIGLAVLAGVGVLVAAL